MIKQMVTGIAMCGLASPALGLSCLAPTMAEQFNIVAASDDIYLLAEGRFSTNAELPRVTSDGAGAGGPRTHVADTAVLRFSGRHLGINADGDLQTDVTVNVNCIVSWCGDYPLLDTRVLAFLRRADDGSLVLDAGPCPGETYEAPSARDINVLRSCMQNGVCGAQELEAISPF